MSSVEKTITGKRMWGYLVEENCGIDTISAYMLAENCGLVLRLTGKIEVAGI
jgi:hypothetical protein